MLLIITNEADIHPNPVIEILNERGMPFFRLNTDKLLVDYDISYKITESENFFEIKYKRAEHKINSKQISCVWERRPVKPEMTYDNFDSQQIRETILEEADGFIIFLRNSLRNVFWIGHPMFERAARSKILQKIIAKEVGFHIPDTLFSNEFKSLAMFRGKSVAIKPLSAHGIEYDNKDYTFYTCKQTYSDLISLGEESFRNNINFIEEYTDKKYEIRVTVIKDKCIAAKIDSQVLNETQGAVDWRQGYDHNISFSPCVLPNEIASRCVEFLNRLSLNFGCFDFILTPDDKYVFLECNTNGQWMWLDDCGFPIAKALSDVFEEEIRRKQ